MQLKIRKIIDHKFKKYLVYFSTLDVKNFRHKEGKRNSWGARLENEFCYELLVDRL